MKVVNVEGDKKYSYSEVSKFDEYDLKRLEEFGACEVYYYYFQGDYEGSGEALIKKDGKWGVKSLSHCSCYGPLEDLYSTTFYDTLDEVSDKTSDEYNSDILPLIEEARK